MAISTCDSVPALGDRATYRVIELYEGYDWRHDVVLTSGVWPVGTIAIVKWENGIRWTAEYAGNTMRFRVDKTQTALENVPDGTDFELSVAVPVGTGDDSDDILLHYGVAYRPHRLS